MKVPFIGLPLLVTLLLNLNVANAHGIAGKRYFPPTISVEDPYAAHEIHTVVGRVPLGGSNNSNVMSSNVMIGGGIEQIDGFWIAIDGLYRNPNVNLTPEANGFDNLYYTIKKELTINDEREFAFTVGVN